MKTKFLALILMVLGVGYACSDDDKPNYNFVDEATQTAFKADFPKATRVEWEKKQSTEREYFVADFRLEDNKREMEAWYSSATLYLTEKDLWSVEELPPAVKTSLQGSKYGDWRVDDIDQITRPGYETIYIIEVEQGKEEIDLYYNQDGVLLKEVADNPGGSAGDLIPANLPDAIKTYIKTNHANAKIVDVDKEKTKWEVDIVEGGQKKELEFSIENNAWLLTKWEVAIISIPDVVRDGIAASPYADWKIDEVDRLDNPQGKFYLIEFEKTGEKDVKRLFGVEDGVMVE